MGEIAELIERLEGRREEALAKGRAAGRQYATRQYHYGRHDAFAEAASLLKALEKTDG